MSRDSDQEAGRLATGVIPPRSPRLDGSIARPSPGKPRVLSFAQQRLWFLDQLEPGRPTYNTPLALRFLGPLEPGALAAALTAIVARHEVLRSTFSSPDGIPLQTCREATPVRMRERDLSDVDADMREATLARLIHEELRRPFTLARDEMLRAVLFRLAGDVHVLLLTIHHIATDGWSMGVLVTELAEHYNAVTAGRPPVLPPLPVQYADYAQWQREWLEGDELERQLAYWTAKLAGAPAVLDLPTDRPRPSIMGWHGGIERVMLAPRLTDALKALSRRQGVTLFMTLLAAFQVLLHRYTGQEDVLVGAPVAGRTRLEIEPLVGFFVNTLVLRTDLRGDPSFPALLRRVRDVCLEAYAHQDLPFERLVETLRPERNRSHSPVVQTVFAFQNTPNVAATFHGLTVTRLEVDEIAAKFDLLLELADRDEGLVGLFRYDTALFDAATVGRMREHFRTLLDGIVAHPDRRLSELSVISDAERHELLVAWNATEREYPRDACVHELFAEQAARTPEATALVFKGRSLSYRGLDRRANQLAHRLRREGVGPETTVAVYLERSEELILGVLGILKAGGAYVPLDAAAPPERLAFMVTDVAASVLVTQARLGARLPDLPLRRIALDADWPAVAQEPDTPLAHGATADSLAYVMYTSGSTGRPKGVSVAHRAITRLVHGTTYIRWGADEVFFQLAPLAFDASTFEIWGSLLHGARLVIGPPGRPSLSELGDALVGSGVTTLWLTAGLFRQMVDHQLPGLRGIRQLLTGGDVVSASHAKRLLEAHPHCTLINGYGPTEGTTFTCCHRISDPTSVGASLPIGRPLENTRVYVLDRWGEPAAVGLPGELYIAGDGLARGYRSRPDLTDERFDVRSLAGRPAERLYRTGDLVRYRADGVIEFLGRLDEQVKIRGYRVEPGEIESALAQHPGVRAGVVVAREDDGDKHLVAYVVPAAGRGVEPAVLRSHLRQTLPEYMVPAAFVELDALPLTANGKVDRAALPAPRPAVAATADALPPAPEERMLMDMWCGLLRRDQVGLDDNFFDLGGHSLLATQLLSRIERAFGARMAVATLFEAPTIRQQAVLLHQQSLEREPRAVRIQPSGSRPPLFFIDLFPLFRALASRLGSDQPFLGLPNPAVALLSHPFSLGEIAAYHVATIRATHPVGPYFIAGWSAGGTVAYEVARQLRASGGEIALLAMFEASSPEYDRHTWQEWARGLQRRFRFHLKRIARLDPREAAPYAVARLRTIARNTRAGAWRRVYRAGLGLGGVLHGRFQSTDQAVLFALSTYDPEPYPGRIIFFRSADRLACFGGPLDFGWGKFALGGVEVHVVPGDHISMFEEPNVGQLAERLRQYLPRPVAE